MPNYKAVNAERLDAALTATADAIREKTSGTDPIPWDADTGFAEAVAGITGGGAAVSVPMKDVNFYDYDGTRLYSYDVAEAAALTELPPLPMRDGLVCQGWNWTLGGIKAAAGAVDAGAVYITDDGKTRVYVTLRDGRTSPMLGCCPNGTVTVDWGDGTTPDVLTGTSTTTAAWTPNHNYAQPGDYVIALTVDGEMGFYSSSKENEYCGILRYSSGADGRNNVYQNSIHRVEIGNGVANITGHAFRGCYHLVSVILPKSVTSFTANAFNSCYSLENIVIPDGVLSIANAMFRDCLRLKNVAFPEGVTTIGTAAFYGCQGLSDIAIPEGLTEIKTNAFLNCHSLAGAALPDGVLSVGSNAFIDCYSLAGIMFPGSVEAIMGGAFSGCSGMKYYDFTRHTGVPSLSSTTALEGIPSDCEIRVPASLVDAWKAATNWATYADYIVGV